MRGPEILIVSINPREFCRSSLRSRISESTLRQSLVKAVSFQSLGVSKEIAGYDSLVRQRSQKAVYFNLAFKNKCKKINSFSFGWRVDYLISSFVGPAI